MRITKNQYRVAKVILPTGKVLDKPTTRADELGVKRTTICDTLKKWEEHLQDDGVYEPTFLKELTDRVEAFEKKHPDLLWAPSSETPETPETPDTSGDTPEPAASKPAPKKKATKKAAKPKEEATPSAVAPSTKKADASKPKEEATPATAPSVAKPKASKKKAPAKKKASKPSILVSSSVNWAESGEDRYTMFGTLFDVQKARIQIAAGERPIHAVEIAQMAEFIGAPPANGEIAGGLLTVDWGRVKGNTNIDLDHPLILGQADGGTVLIDGWHRVARATVKGIALLPAVMLDEAETAAIRKG